MPRSILIRNIDDDLAHDLTILAARDGMKREAWIKQQLVKIVGSERITSSYCLAMSVMRMRESLGSIPSECPPDCL